MYLYIFIHNCIDGLFNFVDNQQISDIVASDTYTHIDSTKQTKHIKNGKVGICSHRHTPTTWGEPNTNTVDKYRYSYRCRVLLW